MLYILDTDHAIHSVTSQNNRMNLYLCHESKSTGKNFGLQISQLIPANASLRSTFPSLLQETIELTFNQFSVGSTNAPYEIVVVKIKLHAGNQKVHVNCFWHLLLDVIHSSVISLGRPKKNKKGKQSNVVTLSIDQTAISLLLFTETTETSKPIRQRVKHFCITGSPPHNLNIAIQFCRCALASWDRTSPELISDLPLIEMEREKPYTKAAFLAWCKMTREYKNEKRRVYLTMTKAKSKGL